MSAASQAVAVRRPGAEGVLARAWAVAAALVVIVVIAAAALGTRPGRAALYTGLFSLDVLAPSPVQPLNLLTRAPIIDRVSYGSVGRNVEAVVYRPRDGGRHGAVIISMGVRAWPLDSPRLVRWASDAARAGVVVMAIDSPELRFDEVRPSEVEDLVQAFLYLDGQPYVDSARVGFLGISVGGSLALLAAADQRIADQVGFLHVMGAYYSVKEYVRAVTTGEANSWEPSPVAATVLPKQVIDFATRGVDRAILLAIFYQQRPEAREGVPFLSPRGRAVFDLFDNKDPARFEALFAALDPEGVAALRRLSPAYVVDQIEAPLLILHSRRDHHVPISEAEALRAATAGRLAAEMTTFSAFDHVDPQLSVLAPALVSDGLKLYAYLFRLILRLS